MYNNEISSFEFILIFWHSTFCISRRIFWKRYYQIDLFRHTVFFSAKTISKVVIIRTKIASFAFFSSPPFFLLALSFSPFLFLRQCDFQALIRERKKLLALIRSNGWKFVGFVFKNSARS